MSKIYKQLDYSVSFNSMQSLNSLLRGVVYCEGRFNIEKSLLYCATIFICVVLSFVFIWQEWYPSSSSVYLDHLLQVMTWCTFRGAVLYISVIRVFIWASVEDVPFLSVYISLAFLLWPLCSTRDFRPQNSRSLDVFWQFSLNFKMVACEKRNRSAILEIVRLQQHLQ